jgi:beta-glucosidase
MIAATMATSLYAIDHDQRARDLVSKMTFEEKVSLLSGETSFSIRAIPRLGIPRVLFADGPQGVRNQTPHSTLYPCGILTAATWDRDIAGRVGESIGRDARARGIGVMLGPGVNSYRSPLCGRNFEYFGEDPYLASETTAAYIIGLQSNGVVATVKHFAANNQEWDRHHVSSDVDERTMQEIYLPTFHKAVKAGVGAVMNSYNLLNGVHATENDWLNNKVLKGDWGFDGILMSDWVSVYSTIGAANGGLDLEMPKAVWFTYDKLKAAVDAGRISQATIDDKVVRMLRIYSRFGLLDREQKDSTIPLDSPISAQTALDAARGGIVLLKNEGSMLPLKGRTVVLGTNADRVTTGGGSGFVSPFHSTTLAGALKKMQRNTVVLSDSVLFEDILSNVWTDSTCTQHGFAAKYYSNQELKGEPTLTRIDKSVNFNWKKGAPHKSLPNDHFSAEWTGWVAPADHARQIKLTIGGDDGYRVFVNGKLAVGEWSNHQYSAKEIQLAVAAGESLDLRINYYDSTAHARINFAMGALNESLLEKELRRADNVVLCTGFDSATEGEGFDRPFSMPDYQVQFIKRVAAINPHLAVVLNSGGGVEMTQWIDVAPAVVMAWYAGQEGGTAIAEILTGKLSPSGRLPISIERNESDNPSSAFYYATSTPRNESAHVDYGEGIFTGYRGYDRSGVKPMFPFGYGLSYTTFEYSDLKLTELAGDSVQVEFDVKNTGKVASAEVAQVYVSDKECSVARPAKELKGYDKVYLKAGEKRHITVMLDSESFAFYDVNIGKFRVEPGEFVVSVGHSSAELPLTASIELK